MRTLKCLEQADHRAVLSVHGQVTRQCVESGPGACPRGHEIKEESASLSGQDSAATFVRPDVAWMGGSRLMGKQPALSGGHAWESVVGHEARAHGATAPARPRSALSGEHASAPVAAPNSGHRVPTQADRGVHRRLLLARMPRSLRTIQVESGLLDAEDRC